MENVQIITTADGSHSLIDTSLNETYHSRHGARQESLHIFIQNGLDYYRSRYSPVEIRILEVGFGTGLNALLALQWSKTFPTQVHYTGIELNPLPKAVWEKLNYTAWQDKEGDFYRLHELPWGVDHALEPNFFFRKQRGSIQDYLRSKICADIIFYDAFAPEKQPEMWTAEILSMVERSMAPHGIFVTYSAKGQLKRTLKTLGLHVESLPGPPGKTEMTRATKGGDPR